MVTWETVAVPLVGGIDTKTDTKTLPTNKLQLLENGEFTKGGSLRKRLGYTNLSGPSDDLLSVFSRRDELVTVSREKLYSYEPNEASWVTAGDYCPITHTVLESARISFEQSAPDAAEVNNVAVFAWEDSRGGIRCAVHNSSTGTVYAGDLAVQSSNAIRPRCVVVNTNILVLYADTSMDAIKALVIRTADITASLAGSPVVVINDLNSNRVFDACAGSDRGYLLYADDGAVGSGYRLCTFNSGGVVTAFATMPGGFGIYTPEYAAINFNTTTEQVSTFIWETGETHQYEVWESDLTAVDGEDEVEADVTNLGIATIGTVTPSDGTRLRYQERSDADPSNYSVLVEGGDSALTWRHCGLASSPVVVGDYAYVLLTHESRTGVQNSYYLMRHDGVLCGRILSSDGAGIFAEGILPRLTAVGDTLQVALPFKRQLIIRDTSGPVAGAGQSERRGIKLVTFDVTATPRSAELDSTLYMSGSQVWAFDGQAPVEVGFHMFPDVLTGDITLTVDAGDTPSSGTRNYRVYYEYTLTNGQRMRSAAITRVSPTLDGNKVQLEIPTLSFTNKEARGPVSIVVYASESNASIFHYRISNPDPTTAGDDNGYLANDTTVDSVTFIDNFADDDLLDKEVDYLSRGELPHFGPEGCTNLAVAQNRLWLVGGGENPNSARYSLIHLDGEPVEFARQAVSEAPDYGGLTTGVGHVNETVVVFKERAIYTLDGEGPDNTGQNGFYVVKPLSADTGTTEPGSILSTSDGVYFKSPEGINLLDQGGQIVYIGAEAEAYNPQFCTDASQVPDTNQIVFLMSSGRSLMFDTYYKQWSVYTNHIGLGATTWRGTEYVYLREGSQVYRRSSTSYLDAGVSYKLKFRTAPLRLKELLQGFWRARKLSVLGEYKTSHRLKVGVYYDRDAAPFETVIFEPDDVLTLSTWGSEATWGEEDTLWGGPAGGRDYHFQHRFKRQKCQSIRLEFEDLSTGVTPGASFELTELALEVGLRDGLGRIPATRKI